MTALDEKKKRTKKGPNDENGKTTEEEEKHDDLRMAGDYNVPEGVNFGEGHPDDEEK
jgi:hypothetical protein